MKDPRDAAPPLLETLSRGLEDKKGIDIQILDLRGLVSYTDFLILCTGTSSTHVSALVHSLRDSLPKTARPVYVNSSKDDSWWILDFVDVVVHIFHEDARRFYDLESLWCDAKRIG